MEFVHHHVYTDTMIIQETRVGMAGGIFRNIKQGVYCWISLSYDYIT